VVAKDLAQWPDYVLYPWALFPSKCGLLINVQSLLNPDSHDDPSVALPGVVFASVTVGREIEPGLT
jgi:hypothetical protein